MIDWKTVKRGLLGISAPPQRSVDMIATNPVEVGYAIKVENIRQEPPEFRRKYRLNIGNGIHIEGEAKNGYGPRFNDIFWLQQANGRSILFHGSRIADDILRTELIPLIEEGVSRIKAIDREFINSSPFEFTDTKGRIWRLA